jgi:hypothetical protein
MPEAHESMEHAESAEHASHSNRKIALVIAVLSLFLSLSEMLGKSAHRKRDHPAHAQGSELSEPDVTAYRPCRQ